MHKRKRAAKPSVNGHTNGIAEETSADELATTTATLEKDKQNIIIKPKIDWEIPRKTLHSSIGISSPHVRLFLYL